MEIGQQNLKSQAVFLAKILKTSLQTMFPILNGGETVFKALEAPSLYIVLINLPYIDIDVTFGEI